MGSDAGESGDPIARAEHLLKEGEHHFQQGHFVEAMELWRQGQTLLFTPSLIDRADSDALLAILAMKEGRAFFSLGQIEKALAAYARAWDLHALPHMVAQLELDKERADLAMNEGNALDSLGRLEEALSAYGRARDHLALPHLAVSPEIDKTRAMLAINQGITLDTLGRCEEALVAYAEARDLLALPHLATRLELDGLRAVLATNEGTALDSLGRLEEALVVYARARGLYALPHLAARLELDSYRAALAMNEGNALQSIGRVEEALAAHARAWDLHELPHLATRLELDDSRAALAMNEGNALQSLGRLEDALAAYARAWDLHARPHLSSRVELDDTRATLAMNAGYVFASLCRFEEALAAFARARGLHSMPHLAKRLELDDDRAALAVNEGAALLSLGRPEEALVAFARARDLHALPHLAARPELDGSRADIAMNEGAAFQHLDRLEDALAAYARAWDLHALPHLAVRPELDSDRARLAVNQGFTLDSLGRFAEALVAYARARELHTLPHLATRRELDSDRATLVMNEGATLGSLSRFEEALSAYTRARDLYALPHLASRPELDNSRAKLSVNGGVTLASLGRLEEALSAYRTASRLWSGQRDLPLPEQARFASCLASMSALLDEMAAEDPEAARAWALGSSDRLVEMLDLALPEGKVWDDLRDHFATFHTRWLAWCLSSGDPAELSLVPRVLAAVQGRRLVAETLEQAMALGEAAAPEIRDVLAIKAEMRALLQALGAAEGSHDPGGVGRDGPGPSGTRGRDAAAGFGRPRRDADRIAAIRVQLQSARDRLGAAKRAAAELPEFAILAAPLSGIGTAALAATLAPDEALVVAFPLPEDKAKPRAASAVSETEEEAASTTPVWLWALRSDGSDPIVLRVGAEATEDAPSSLPDWAGSLPGVLDRWEQFSAAMGGRGGVRRGDLDREAAGGVVPVAARKAGRALSPNEMSSFWSDLDAALASLVWRPLAATGVLDGVEDILIATAGSLHNLPFSVGRRGVAAEARLLHQSSLASFARSRGLLGARPVAPETLAKIRAGMGAADGIARQPAVTLLAADADAPGQEIPLARAERRIAARIWAAAGAEVRLGDDYPLDPDAPVALAHAACHGMTATPKGGTSGAHLLLRSAVSERTLLGARPAGAWLMGACVGGRVHDDTLDGNPTGIVAGALAAGSETVVAALPPLPDREAFFFGVLVTLQLADPPLGAAALGRPGPADEADGPVDLVTAATLAAAIVGGAREAADVERALPRRTLAALGGRDALVRRLAWLDAGLRWALAEELADMQGAALVAAMTSGPDDGSAAPVPHAERAGRIFEALTSAAPALALCRPVGTERSGALPVRVTDALAEALAASAADVTGDDAGAAAGAGPSLVNLLTRALLSLPGAFAVLPEPANPKEHDPTAAGAIAHGIVTFHHPGKTIGATEASNNGACPQ